MEKKLTTNDYFTYALQKMELVLQEKRIGKKERNYIFRSLLIMIELYKIFHKESKEMDVNWAEIYAKVLTNVKEEQK